MQAEILVIEDEESINDLICMNLEAIIFEQVQQFSDIAFLDNKEIELAITDIGIRRNVPKATY